MGRNLETKICSRCKRHLKARKHNSANSRKLYKTSIGEMCGKCKQKFWFEEKQKAFSANAFRRKG